MLRAIISRAELLGLCDLTLQILSFVAQPIALFGLAFSFASTEIDMEDLYAHLDQR